MRRNYMINVFVDGKCVESYFTETLDGLMTAKAVHKGCEIDVFDMRTMQRLSEAQVKAETHHSYRRWNETKGRKEDNEPVVVKRNRKINNWSRHVRCVETGKEYRSISACSRDMGIPNHTIVDNINTERAVRGYHFIEIQKRNIKKVD